MAKDSAKGKVGSDLEAAKEFGGKGDFGIPASEASEVAGGRGKGPDQGTGFSRSGSRGIRTSGVGAPIGGDGSGSGGDLDPDVIGLDGRGGVSNNPDEHKRRGADIVDGLTDPFASGPPAAGTYPPSAPRGTGAPTFDTVDHSGGDASTSGDESDETENPEIEEIAQETDIDRTAEDR